MQSALAIIIYGGGIVLAALVMVALDALFGPVCDKTDGGSWRR